MTRIEYLETRLDALETRLDMLTGIPRKPISMTEARIARERGDMATVRRYLAQYEIAGGDSGEVAAITAATVCLTLRQRRVVYLVFCPAEPSLGPRRGKPKKERESWKATSVCSRNA